MSDAVTGPALWATRLYALVLAVVALVLLVGGGKLVTLGGSPYYVLAGAAVLVSAVLLWMGRRKGAAVYGGMLLATIVWALWEVGPDGWALTARLAAPFVLGLFLLIPGMPGAPSSKGLVKGLVALVVAVAAGLALHAVAGDHPVDPVEQAGRSAFPGARLANAGSGADWLNYGGDSAGSRFTQLTQVTPANVGKLQVAWTYRVGDNRLEVTPLKVGSSLYLCDSANDVFALDAETGKQLWRVAGNVPKALRHSCRGVAYYAAPGLTGPCAERIISNTVDARLIALDARTGAYCPGFGQGGTVNLLKGLSAAKAGYYAVTSAPTIVKGKVVLGGWVSDNQYWGEPSGVIRAFDAVTGQFAWAFDAGRTDRQTEPPPGETYTPSTPNSWSPMSADEQLGLVYAPTGNATPDYYGAQRRPFDDQYSSSVVAIDADTGKVRWSFQTTHHDVWDYDVASQPSLVDLDGGRVKAMIVPTKRAELFLLDRVTGKPLATVNEHPAPQAGHAPGERLSPTQPFSDGLPSFRGPDLTEKMMWGVTPLDQLWCRIAFKDSRYEGPLTPIGWKRAVIYPGYLGGMDWGGASIDPDRGLAFVNTNRVAIYGKLMSREEANRKGILPLGVPGSKLTYVGGAAPEWGTPFAADIGAFMSPLRAPCNAPPYGKLSAIDLNTHRLVWTKTIGTARNSGPLGVASHVPFLMGTPNLGGSLATRSGLLFIGATQDRYLRAISTATGEELWKASLPTGGHATPMSYVSPASGRQFVVIAASGNAAMGTKPGDYVIGYALPKN